MATAARMLCGFYLLFILSFLLQQTDAEYQPNWESLDKRILPSWYDEAKFGIFLHWGVFSVPSYGSEWFWWYWKGSKTPYYVDFMNKNYPPDFTYPDFAPKFTTEFFNAKEWANLFEAAGAKYVVLTSKHHEGFTNWPSKVSWNWNSMAVGPHRDLVGELAVAIKETSIHFGLYHSLLEWFHPLYLQDKASNFTTHEFAKTKAIPELYEIVKQYKPEVIWSDGDWECDDTYWNSTQFLAWLYNESPVKDTVCVNDRWGKNVRCKHGGFLNCNDRYNPGVLVKKKWENAMTIDRYSWGYRRNLRLQDLLTVDKLIAELAETVSCGGNLLVNVGPTHDGRISPIFEERLLQFGQWLKLNGEAIYSSKPWLHQNDTITPRVWYTSNKASNGTAVYAIVLDRPKGNLIHLGSVDYLPSISVSLLGYSGNIVIKETTFGILLMIPNIQINQMPSKRAWVFKFMGAKF
ncbi:alpha-L-fucosidase isoform X1 [Octopus bimaculoides]|uniref:alpha-L-fucosidase n=1 Tax=Octopus bimaculoides TaxID=37653 RepID=A0A0L8HTH8_OCTBM|nr:alpha-L-fucosidase isoform X1 [Octopus bimaculoides]|eukprot:XP_014769556.1 PREDICTED: alpha-L-fucosidase-like isoform X1 [Octopus bimaculoides]